MEREPRVSVSSPSCVELVLHLFSLSADTLLHSMAAPPSSLEKTALLILDVQNDFLLPHGALPVVNGESIIPVITRLRAFFPPTQVYHTQDWHPADHISFSSQHPGVPLFTTIQLSQWPQLILPAHGVQNTWGAELHDAFKPLPAGAHIVRKGGDAKVESHSAFYDILGGCTGLYPLLRSAGVERLWVCGVHTDVLVAKTVRDALRHFPAPGAVTVVSDAITGFVPARFAPAIAEMQQLGAVFVPSSALLG